MEENIDRVVNGGNVTSNKVYIKTFMWMFLGLLATGVIATISFASGFTYNYLITLWGPLALIELVVVLLFSFLARKLPPAVAGALFFIYSILNGITLSTIFVVFELASVILVFFATSAVFGACALFGYFTKVDLSKIRTIFLVTIIIAIIVSIINLFIGIPFVDTVIDWVVLLVFFGVTAWDMQKIKMYSENSNLTEDNIAIYCAMDLYLDFINIFIRLLRIFGRRK